MDAGSLPSYTPPSTTTTTTTTTPTTKHPTGVEGSEQVAPEENTEKTAEKSEEKPQEKKSSKEIASTIEEKNLRPKANSLSSSSRPDKYKSLRPPKKNDLNQTAEKTVHDTLQQIPKTPVVAADSPLPKSEEKLQKSEKKNLGDDDLVSRNRAISTPTLQEKWVEGFGVVTIYKTEDEVKAEENAAQLKQKSTQLQEKSTQLLKQSKDFSDYVKDNKISLIALQNLFTLAHQRGKDEKLILCQTDAGLKLLDKAIVLNAIKEGKNISVINPWIVSQYILNKGGRPDPNQKAGFHILNDNFTDFKEKPELSAYVGPKVPSSTTQAPTITAQTQSATTSSTTVPNIEEKEIRFIFKVMKSFQEQLENNPDNPNPETEKSLDELKEKLHFFGTNSLENSELIHDLYTEAYSPTLVQLAPHGSPLTRKKGQTLTNIPNISADSTTSTSSTPSPLTSPNTSRLTQSSSRLTAKSPRFPSPLASSSSRTRSSSTATPSSTSAHISTTSTSLASSSSIRFAEPTTRKASTATSSTPTPSISEQITELEAKEKKFDTEVKKYERTLEKNEAKQFDSELIRELSPEELKDVNKFLLKSKEQLKQTRVKLAKLKEKAEKEVEAPGLEADVEQQVKVKKDKKPRSYSITSSAKTAPFSTSYHTSTTSSPFAPSSSSSSSSTKASKEKEVEIDSEEEDFEVPGEEGDMELQVNVGQKANLQPQESESMQVIQKLSTWLDNKKTRMEANRVANTTQYYNDVKDACTTFSSYAINVQRSLYITQSNIVENSIKFFKAKSKEILITPETRADYKNKRKELEGLLMAQEKNYKTNVSEYYIKISKANELKIENMIAIKNAIKTNVKTFKSKCAKVAVTPDNVDATIEKSQEKLEQAKSVSTELTTNANVRQYIGSGVKTEEQKDEMSEDELKAVEVDENFEAAKNHVANEGSFYSGLLSEMGDCIIEAKTKKINDTKEAKKIKIKEEDPSISDEALNKKVEEETKQEIKNAKDKIINLKEAIKAGIEAEQYDIKTLLNESITFKNSLATFMSIAATAYKAVPTCKKRVESNRQVFIDYVSQNKEVQEKLKLKEGWDSYEGNDSDDDPIESAIDSFHENAMKPLKAEIKKLENQLESGELEESDRKKLNDLAKLSIRCDASFQDLKDTLSVNFVSQGVFSEERLNAYFTLVDQASPKS